MTIYRITAPNGRTYQIEGPPGASDAQVAQAVIAQNPEAAQAPAEPKETTFGGNVKEFFKGVVPGAIGLAESAAVGASALLPEEAEKATRKYVKETAESARKPFEAGAGYEESVGRKLGEAVGSTIPFLASGPFGVAGRIGATALGVGAGAGEARGRAEEGGAAAGDRGLATALGAAVGTAEMFAPLRILGRLSDPIKQGAAAQIKRALVAGGEEGAQEAATQIAQNLIAKGIYKPEQAIIEQVGESAAYGGATGALVQGLLDLAIGRRAKGAGAPGAVPDAEARAQAERERREQLKLEQGLGEEAKAAEAKGYVGQQGQLFRGLPTPTQPQRDLAGQILEPAPDEAAPRPSDLYEGMPLTTEVAQEAGFARTPEELEAAGQQQLGLDQAQDTEFFQQELATLDKEYADLQAKKAKTPADNQRMRDIRTRRTQLTEMVRERTANRGPQLKQGQDQGTLFQSLKKPTQPALGLTGQPLTPAPDEAALRPSEVAKGMPVTTAAARKAGVALTPKELEAAGQTDLMLEATFEYADLVKMREQLKAMEQTPEIQRRIKYLDGQIRDYTLAGVDQAYQQRLEREASRPSPEQVAREAALAEQSAFAQIPEGQPVPEPTVRAKPTPETVPTLMSPDVLGTLGIGHSAILRKPTHPIHGLDIAKPEDAAEVKKMLTVYKEGKSAPIVQKVDAYLARPEFQGVPDVSATPTPQPAPAISNQPRGRKRGVALPVQPATTELSEPGPGTAPTTEAPAVPVGRGLVPAGPDVGTRDEGISGKQPAVTDPLEKYEGLTGATRADAIRGEIGLNNKVIAKASKKGETQTVDQLTQDNARLESLLPEAESRDDRDRRSGIDRQILGQSKSELDTAVANGEMTRAEADALVEEARQTGEVGAASERILEGVDKKETKPKRGELTLAKARDTAGDLDLDPETTKAKVKAFAARLFKAGLIDEISLNATVDIGKDRDMGPEDMIDEIEAALDFYEQEQGKVTPAKKERRSTPTTATGQTLDSMQAEVANMPGVLGAALRRMLQSGKVKLEAAAPGGRKIAGVYDGKTVTLYANGIPEGKVLAVALHEVGAHLGMKNLVGAKAYDAIIARLQKAIEKADGSVESKMAQAAYKRIPIRDMKRGPEVFGDELLAYFVEEMALSEAAGTLPKVGAIRNMWNQIKTGIINALNRVFGTSLGINSLTAEQIQMIAKAAFTKESYTAAQGEVSAEKERNSIPGTAELDPASRAAIKALQDKLPVGERGPDGVVGQAVQGIQKARENSGIITTFRQAAADKFASVESKVSRMFSKGVRDSFGNLNPMVLVRQAEDNAKIIMDFFRAGGIRVNKEGLVESFEQDKSMVSALNKVKQFADANNMTYAEAKAEVSTVLEGHRVFGIREYNNELEQSAIILAGKGKTKEAAEERARKIQLHMTNAEIDTMESIYQKSKGIQSIQADLNATRTQAIDLMVATGRITKEQGQFWKDNEAYVPFDRVFEDTAVAPKFTRGKGLAVLRNIPGMEGSLGRPVRNVLDAYANRLSWMVEDTMRNNASVKLLETMELGGFAKEIDKPEAAQNRNLVVPRLYRDGKPVFFEVQNEYDMLAFQQAPEIMNGLTKALGATARVLRLSITAMPPFAIKQVVDDAQRAAFYSGVQRPLVVAMKTLYNFPKVFFGELTGRKSVAVKRMEELGIIGDYDFNIYEPVADIEKEIGAAKRSVAGKMFHRLEQFTKASDLAARLAVYEETMRETKSATNPEGDELLAQTRARELINFTRRGSSATMRTAARVIPFFNAYAQGMDVLYRAASGIDGSSSGERSAARRLFMSRVAIMTAFGFAYALAMSDDDGYENATDEVRDNNWLLPGGYKIPVPKELAFVFKSIPERVVQYMKRLGTEEEQDITKALGSVVKAGFSAYGSPNAVPSFIRPVLENMTNYSFFLQRELESASMQRREAGQRFTSTTSELAKALGDATNMSPIKIDNFLRGTFGMAGSTTLLMTDAMLNPSRPDRPLYQMPFGSIFLYDTVGGRKKAEFYDLREKVGQADATYKDLLKTDPEKAQKFLESKEALIAAAPMVNATLRDLSQMRALRTMVEQGSEEMLGMSGTERRELIDEIRQSENEMVSYTRELEKMLRE